MPPEMKRKWKYPSGRDIKQSSMIGDVLVNVMAHELVVVSAKKTKGIEFTIYSTDDWIQVRKDVIPFGPMMGEFIKPLTPVHEICEVDIRSWMLSCLSLQNDELDAKMKSMQGFLEHIAGLLEMNGANPEQMRMKIIGLIERDKQR